MGLFYHASTWLTKFLLLLLTRWRVRGKEKVPRQGSLIVVANHLHMADPPLVSASIPRRIVFMAKVELFRSWGTPIVRAFGAFPVKKRQADRSAFRQSLAILEQGLALGVFPEGMRSRQGLRSAFLGAAWVALRTGAPLLPVAITGTEKLKGTGWLRRPQVTVTIGEPFYPPNSEKKLTKEALRAFTDVIMTRIAELLPPSYQGAYGQGSGNEGRES